MKWPGLSPLYALSGQISVDSRGSSNAGSHGVYHSRGAGDRITCRVESGQGGPLQRIGCDTTPLGYSKWSLGACAEAADLANGNKGKIKVHVPWRHLFINNRPGDALFIRGAGLRSPAFKGLEAAAVAVKRSDLGTVFDGDALFERFPYFFFVGWDLFLAEPGNHGNLSAKTGKGSGQVKGRVAVTDDRCLLVCEGVVLPLSAGEEGEASLNSVEILSGDSEFAVSPAADGQKGGVVGGIQFGEPLGRVNMLSAGKI